MCDDPFQGQSTPTARAGSRVNCFQSSSLASRDSLNTEAHKIRYFILTDTTFPTSPCYSSESLYPLRVLQRQRLELLSSYGCSELDLALLS